MLKPCHYPMIDRRYIARAMANTDEFGQSGDFEKLYELLRKK